MRVQRREPIRAAACLACCVVAAALGGTAAGGDLFDEIYQRGQKQNGSLRTLTAAFTEATTSPLMSRPLMASGTVAVERPSRVALRYTGPDERLVLVDGDRLIVSWPARGISRTRDIGASQRRIQKYFVNSSPSELRTHFDIGARETPDRTAYVITLVPTRKPIKEGISRLELTIDERSLLMTSMRMTFPNGDTKLMTFTEITPNAPIDPAVFRVNGTQ